MFLHVLRSFRGCLQRAGVAHLNSTYDGTGGTQTSRMAFLSLPLPAIPIPVPVPTSSLSLSLTLGIALLGLDYGTGTSPSSSSGEVDVEIESVLVAGFHREDRLVLGLAPFPECSSIVMMSDRGDENDDDYDDHGVTQPMGITI